MTDSALDVVPEGERGPTSDLDALEAETQRRRARIEQALDAIGARVRAKKEKLDDYADQIEAIDDGVRRHRWPLLGLAVLVGGFVGRRRRRRPQVFLLPAHAESLRELPPTPPRTLGRALFRSALSAFASHFARRAAEHFLDRTQPPPPPRPPE